MQLPIQPFIKLAQANMELLTRFSTSPEVVSQSAAIAQALVQQSQHAASSLMQSSAFTHLTEGLLKNYTEFVAEWSHSAMTALAQAPAAMVARAQEVTGNVIDVTEARGRRGRRAA
jgi:hypothetical protein